MSMQDRGGIRYCMCGSSFAGVSIMKLGGGRDELGGAREEAST